MALVTSRAAIAVVRIGTGGDTGGTEVVGSGVQRAPAWGAGLLGAAVGVVGVAVIARGAQLAPLTHRVVKAGAAATRLQMAAGGMAGAVARQTLELPADLVHPHVTEVTLLARETRVTSWAHALLHPVGPRRTESLVRSVIQGHLVQASFDLVRVEFGPDHEPLDVVEDGEELVLGDVIAVVLGPLLPRDVADAVGDVVPVLLDQPHLDGRVGLVRVAAVPVGDLHATAL